MTNNIRKLRNSASSAAIVLSVHKIMIGLVFNTVYRNLLFRNHEYNLTNISLAIIGGLVVVFMFFWIPYSILYYVLLTQGNFIEFYIFNDKKIITSPLLLGLINALFYLFVSFLWLPLLGGAFTLGYSEIPVLPLYTIFFSIVILTPVLCRLLKIDRFVVNFYNQSIRNT